MPSPIEEAVRKDSAVHVSLSSDSPVKQPGTLRLPLQSPEEPTKLEPPTKSRRPDPTNSEELQRRAIAPIAGGAPYGHVYMSRPYGLSTV